MGGDLFDREIVLSNDIRLLYIAQKISSTVLCAFYHIVMSKWVFDIVSGYVVQFLTRIDHIAGKNARCRTENKEESVMSKNHAQDLRRILAENKFLTLPGVYDCLSGKIAEEAGFPALFLSGGALAYSCLLYTSDAADE